jgi:hypothetical protein
LSSVNFQHAFFFRERIDVQPGAGEKIMFECQFKVPLFIAASDYFGQSRLAASKQIVLYSTQYLSLKIVLMSQYGLKDTGFDGIVKCVFRTE